MAAPLEMLRDHSELLIKQTRKGCCQECMGCEATNEFLVFPNVQKAKDSGNQIMYSKESSSFCCRLCCLNQRSFTQTVWSGTKDAKGSEVMAMDRPFTCPLAPLTCCCVPTIAFKNGDAVLGSAQVPCFLCVPALDVLDASGQKEFQVQQPTCCGGCCVNCWAEGCCNCKTPFYVYKPGVTPSSGNQVGKIVKLWRGIGTEFFTDAASFRVEYPPDASAESKARLMGTTFFINILFFEKGANEENKS